LAAHRIRSALRWQEQNRPGGQSPAKSLDAPDPYLFLLVVKILVRKQPVGRMAVSSSCWLSLDSGAKRSPVYNWEELDLAQRIWTLPKSCTKNAKAHIVHLSEQSMAVLTRADRPGPYVFSLLGTKRFQEFSRAKRRLDQLSGVTGWRLHDLRRTCVSGMARLGVAPHVADKILNHQAGTISGVAAVYQRHDFLAERRAALDLWGAHVGRVLTEMSQERRVPLRIVV
jgi:integrase